LRKLLAIDPGTFKSAWLTLDLDEMVPISFGILENDKLINLVADWRHHLAIEIMKSYGNVIGDSVLITCEWIGRFTQASDYDPIRLTRSEIVVNICHDSRAGDKNVRRAIMDRFGGRAIAVAQKRQPGPLYGVSYDVWSALAIGLTAADKYGDFL